MNNKNAPNTILGMTMHDLSQWIKDTFTPSYQKEVEAYLAECVDVFDLEQRIRILQRRGMI